MTEREALKLVLEYMNEYYPSYAKQAAHHHRVNTAIKEALAQPEQELIEDLQDKLKWATERLDSNINWEFVASAKEAMLKAAWAEIKELREQTKELREQEPVAHMYPCDLEEFKSKEMCAYAYSIEYVSASKGETIPLYTTPPQRKPLTKERIDEAIQQHVDPVATYRKLHDFARAIEAKLKEKNFD